MNPKQFLVWGGLVLVVVGVLGFFGLIGPTSADSIFGAAWWFDNAENWAHLILGLVALLVAYVFPMGTHKTIVILVGVLGLFFAAYNLYSTKFLAANLESPADLVLHLAVGVWALYAAFNKRSQPMSMPM